jgi:opacity protein-like surface antigen
MRTSLAALLLTVVTAAPLFAQDAPSSVPPDAPSRGYIIAKGGLAWFSNMSGFSTSGKQATTDVGADLGIRLGRHFLVFGDGGWIRNLQRGVQPILVNTTNTIYADHLVSLTGGGSLRTLYGLGGAGIMGPALGQFIPYVIGGIGIARFNPTTHFTYNSGTIPGLASPAAGTDVTAALTAARFYNAPGTSTASVLMGAGGLQLALKTHLVLDGRYSYMRVGSDSALSATSYATNMLTFGVGARF